MLLEALTCPTNSTKKSKAKLIIFLTLINHLVATKKPFIIPKKHLREIINQKRESNWIFKKREEKKNILQLYYKR